mmetsp:Transcript_10401/g.18336  ORF Transcript_10401/g.18336 Transcript_10401/m.18336 type:complete len:159 (-) Transcript_10401:464-940(-)|eukprot:CAMPEP_0184545530 /NCGR_PEP_ID=MMETSP0199_2-20130426/4366_1 /TAXON_ID=1112570 /ORGANISM="Thraustochytrium sp., Strain LLF1b" /LENGTH=158 /DNA_ID=CAMNT_0026939837 /DNA_START=302 /DNA_END=778 /DNA_ORIENTATION=+
MSDIARTRLAEERRQWRRDHPPGFYARPEKRDDGSTDLMRWLAGIPGRENTIWEGGLFHLRLIYPEDFPSSPPKVQFVPTLFHPNVYPSGTVCLSILNAEEDWNPTVTLKQILLGIQDLLNDPNPNSPAQSEPFALFTQDREKYKQRVREVVAQNPPM